MYKNMADAMKKHPEVDVLISFASLRSAFDSTMETMNYPQVSASERDPSQTADFGKIGWYLLSSTCLRKD